MKNIVVKFILAAVLVLLGIADSQAALQTTFPASAITNAPWTTTQTVSQIISTSSISVQQITNFNQVISTSSVPANTITNPIWVNTNGGFAWGLTIFGGVFNGNGGGLTNLNISGISNFPTAWSYTAITNPPWCTTGAVSSIISTSAIPAANITNPTWLTTQQVGGIIATSAIPAANITNPPWTTTGAVGGILLTSQLPNTVITNPPWTTTGAVQSAISSFASTGTVAYANTSSVAMNLSADLTNWVLSSGVGVDFYQTSTTNNISASISNCFMFSVSPVINMMTNSVVPTAGSYGQTWLTPITVSRLEVGYIYINSMFSITGNGGPSTTAQYELWTWNTNGTFTQFPGGYCSGMMVSSATPANTGPMSISIQNATNLASGTYLALRLKFVTTSGNNLNFSTYSGDGYISVIAVNAGNSLQSIATNNPFNGAFLGSDGINSFWSINAYWLTNLNATNLTGIIPLTKIPSLPSSIITNPPWLTTQQVGGIIATSQIPAVNITNPPWTTTGAVGGILLTSQLPNTVITNPPWTTTGAVGGILLTSQLPNTVITNPPWTTTQAVGGIVATSAIPAANITGTLPYISNNNGAGTNTTLVTVTITNGNWTGLFSLTNVTFTFSGNIRYAVTNVSANYTVSTNDNTVNCLSNSFNVTLPTAVGIEGLEYDVKNSGNGVITLLTTAGQTIDGNASGTIKLGTMDNYTLRVANTNWMIR